MSKLTLISVVMPWSIAMTLGIRDAQVPIEKVAVADGPEIILLLLCGNIGDPILIDQERLQKLPPRGFGQWHLRDGLLRSNR